MLFTGDNVTIMRLALADASIDLTVTSPPYDNLRTYNGFTWDFESLAKELYRVTKPGGVVVWVVGDATVKGSETGTSFRQALYFKDIGFNLYDTMIYEKSGTGACGNNRAYWQSFEYMFILTKGDVLTFNPLIDKPNSLAGSTVTADRKRTNGTLQRTCKERTIPEFSRRTNIWRMTAGFTKTNHPAPFPEALARDHILSWSNPGDTVLDPFLGSGTTGKMALLSNRKFIGIDISDEYVEIARRRIYGV